MEAGRVGYDDVDLDVDVDAVPVGTIELVGRGLGRVGWGAVVTFVIITTIGKGWEVLVMLWDVDVDVDVDVDMDVDVNMIMNTSEWDDTSSTLLMPSLRK